MKYCKDLRKNLICKSPRKVYIVINYANIIVYLDLMIQ